MASGKDSRKNQLHRERKYGARPTPSRDVRAVINIYCDDTVSAVMYFRAVARIVKSSTIKVSSAPRQGATPQDVLDSAQKHVDPLDAADSHWAVIDTETEHHKVKAAGDAVHAAARSRVQVICSCPCFEVWILLHLEDTGGAFSDCRAVTARVAMLWKKEFGNEFTKTNADYSRLLDHIATAIDRARRHWASNDPARTEVYKIFERLPEFKASLPAR